MNLPIEITAFLCAIILMRIAVPITMKIARRYSVVDIPSDRRTHLKPTPRLGGLGISVVLIVTTLLFLPWGLTVKAYISGLLITLLVGVADDFFQIKPSIKFFGQIIAATAFVLISGVSIEYFGDLFGRGNLYTGSWSVPLTVFAIVSVMNALNLIDGMNGLASGLSLIAAMFLLNIALGVGHSDVALLTALFIGCMIGYLYFNMYPAKTFMGDAGSLSLGFTLSTLSILLVFDGTIASNSVKPISLALLLCLPIMDTLYVMISRLSELRSPATPDNRHLHHVLLKLGFSRSATVSLIFLIMLAFCLASVWLQTTSESFQLFFGFIFALLILASFTILSKNDIQLKDKLTPIKIDSKAQKYSSLGMRKYLLRASALVVFLSLVLPLLVTIVSGAIDSSWLIILGLSVFCVYPWRDSIIRKEWSIGIVYLAAAVGMTLSILSGPDWIARYVAAVATLCVVSLVFFNFIANNSKVLVISSFEILTLCVAIVFMLSMIGAAENPAITTAFIACLTGFIATTLAIKTFIELRLRKLNLLSTLIVMSLISTGLLSVIWA